jgi:flagellar protein FliJ
MPRFEFQLEGLLRQRRSIERQRQRELAMIQLEMRQQEEELKQVDGAVQEATRDICDNRLVGALDMNFITAHRRFVAATQRKAMAIVQKMALIQRRLDEVRKSLAEAATRRKVVERELNELDEIGMQLGYRQLAEEAGISEVGHSEKTFHDLSKTPSLHPPTVPEGGSEIASETDQSANGGVE